MKKNRLLALFCLGLIFAQIFAGCGPGSEKEGNNGGDDDAKKAEREQQTEVTSKKEKEQVSEEALPSFIPLKSETDEKLYHLTVQGSVDLDFDGKEEELYFVSDVIDYNNDYEMNFGEFRLNEKPLDLRGLCKTPGDRETGDTPPMLWNIEVIDLDKTDGQRELVVYKTPQEDSDPPFFTAELFHYRKGKWKSLGEMYTDHNLSMEEWHFDPENRKLRFMVRGYFFCNFYHEVEYSLKDGEIIETTGEELAMFDGNQEIFVRAQGTANVYADSESEDILYQVQPGDEIKLVSCKIGEWVKVEMPQGETGYFKYGWDKTSGEEDYGSEHFLDNPRVSSWDIFEDLPAAG